MDMATSLRNQQVVSPTVPLTRGQNFSSAPAGIPILSNDEPKRGSLFLQLLDEHNSEPHLCETVFLLVP